MTPSDWQERLAPWIGSAVQVVTKDGGTTVGYLVEVGEEVWVDSPPESGGNWLIPYHDIREVWVQLVILEGGD